MNWYLDAFKQFNNFTGRSHRTAFWYFMLVHLLLTAIIIGVEIATDNPGWLDLIYSIITLLPFVALVVRRLRDAGFSPWWLLLVLIPGAGVLVLLIFLAQPTRLAFGQEVSP